MADTTLRVSILHLKYRDRESDLATGGGKKLQWVIPLSVGGLKQQENILFSLVFTPGAEKKKVRGWFAGFQLEIVFLFLKMQPWNTASAEPLTAFSNQTLRLFYTVILPFSYILPFSSICTWPWAPSQLSCWNIKGVHCTEWQTSNKLVGYWWLDLLCKCNTITFWWKPRCSDN